MTTVIGLGNAWRGDDAAGLAVARELSALGPPGLRVLEREGDPVGLLDDWTGAGDVVVVDAVASGAAAGTVHRLDATREPLPAPLCRGSSHAVSLAEAIELARALERLPARLRILGVEGASFEAGGRLSPPVARAVGELVAELSARGRPPGS